MGGGDLNSKKSWHPNTMKNQERVWKAEQAAAEEKKRIVELQRERAQERDRAELTDLAKQTSGSTADDRLSWMYSKPDKKGNQEDYLLGKTIDSNYDRSERAEQELIPAVARRVVGSSMLAAGGDAQVDLVRKLREDPLLLVKERERAARAALLNNPLQRRKLTELLRKEQEQRKEKKAKNIKKNDLDDKLAEKLNALGGKKGIDLAALLASDDSSSESSSSDEKSKKKKKKKKSKSKKKSKKKEAQSDGNSSSEDVRHNNRQKDKFKQRGHSKDNSSDEKVGSKRRRERSPSQTEKQKNNNTHQSYSNRSRDREERDDYRDRFKNQVPNRDNPDRFRDSHKDYYREDRRDNNPSRYKDNREQGRYRLQREERRSRSPVKRLRTPSKERGGEKSKGLSLAEREARLAEMAQAGAQHERERGTRVAQQRAAIAAEDARGARPGASGREARALPASLQARIHSNRHNIQRSERHMNEHFARR